MKLSTKPRHWLALIVAVPTMILAVMTAADFSGDPEPPWRAACNGIGSTLTMTLILVNILLDRREKKAE